MIVPFWEVDDCQENELFTLNDGYQLIAIALVSKLDSQSGGLILQIKLSNERLSYLIKVQLPSQVTFDCVW